MHVATVRTMFAMAIGSPSARMVKLKGHLRPPIAYARRAANTEARYTLPPEIRCLLQSMTYRK